MTTMYPDDKYTKDYEYLEKKFLYETIWYVIQKTVYMYMRHENTLHNILNTFLRHLSECILNIN
jgi:virulence-associated protein VapD